MHAAEGRWPARAPPPTVPAAVTIAHQTGRPHAAPYRRGRPPAAPQRLAPQPPQCTGVRDTVGAAVGRFAPPQRPTAQPRGQRGRTPRRPRPSTGEPPAGCPPARHATDGGGGHHRRRGVGGERPPGRPPRTATADAGVRAATRQRRWRPAAGRAEGVAVLRRHPRGHARPDRAVGRQRVSWCGRRPPHCRRGQAVQPHRQAAVVGRRGGTARGGRGTCRIRDAVRPPMAGALARAAAAHRGSPPAPPAPARDGGTAVVAADAPRGGLPLDGRRGGGLATALRR